MLTDNATGFCSRIFGAAVQALRLVHRRTRPYTPRMISKAEQFIRTMLRE